MDRCRIFVMTLFVLTLCQISASSGLTKRDTRGNNNGNDNLGSDNGRNNGNCHGVCEDNSSGNDNGNFNDGDDNGSNNGNCVGNCVGNELGNLNGNANFNSNDNGNENGNCKGNCFHNVAGNANGNANTNKNGKGNSFGNCFGNCFNRYAGNGNENEDSDMIAESETCRGNCFGPQPMYKTSDYIKNFPVTKSPLSCVSRSHFTYFVTPGTHCLEVHRIHNIKDHHAQLFKWVCPAGTAFDISLCGCNHWHLIKVRSTCKSHWFKWAGK